MSIIRLYRFLLTLPLLAALVAAAPSVRAETSLPSLEATLTAARTYFAAADDIVVHLTLTNPSAAPIAVLRWMTPADGLDGPLFTVTHDGVAVPYVGKLVKRAAPTAADYVEVAAGGSVEWDVALSDAYDFAASGTYAITFDVASPYLYADSARGTAAATAAARLTSGASSIDVEGRAHPRSAVPRGVSTGFVGCDSQDQIEVTNARSAAATYASSASAYLGATTIDTHYTEWFGAYDAGRYGTVAENFVNIQNLLGGNPMIFDCSGSGCPSGTYAFVYPSDSTRTIHLCSVFWGIAATGMDSQAGTLIHEASHFTTVAGTNDYVYGQTSARALASSNPAQAIQNADNHEYFAESSTPAGPIATPTPAATATPNGHGFVPPNPDTAKCEKAVAKHASKLAACAATCQSKRADAAFKGKAFDEDACEDGAGKSCRSAYDAAGAKLAPGLCPPCLDATARGTLADGVLSFVDGSNGTTYCAGTVAFGGDDTGFVPPDKDSATCASGVAKNLKKLGDCVARCQAKQVAAAIKGKSFDAEACKRAAAKSCHAAFDGASAKLLAKGICPPCLDAVSQGNAAAAVTSTVEARNEGLYCAGTTPLP